MGFESGQGETTKRGQREKVVGGTSRRRGVTSFCPHPAVAVVLSFPRGKKKGTKKRKAAARAAAKTPLPLRSEPPRILPPSGAREEEEKRQRGRTGRQKKPPTQKRGEKKNLRKTHHPIRFKSRSTHSCECPASMEAILNSGSLWSANHLGVSAIVLPWKISVLAKLSRPK